MKHLVKRKNLDYKITGGWMCEVKRGGSPSGSKVSINDTVYVAQSGYAIFGKGIVLDVKNIVVVSTLEKFVKYALNNSNIKDDSFWLMKIKQYSKLDVFQAIHILEYKLGEVEQFERCYPLEERFLKSSAWYYLEDDFSLSELKVNTHLTLHIPTKVRETVYHQFKINSKVHIVDIDHVVPQSLGGPGNIIENLVPISPSINRRKSNSVPSKLYDLGNKFNIKVPSYIELKHNLFYSSSNELKLAKQIIEKINSQNIEYIKHDYQLVRSYHFPNV